MNEFKKKMIDEKKFKGLNGIYNMLFERVLVYLMKKKLGIPNL